MNKYSLKMTNQYNIVYTVKLRELKIEKIKVLHSLFHAIKWCHERTLSSISPSSPKKEKKQKLVIKKSLNTIIEENKCLHEKLVKL